MDLRIHTDTRPPMNQSFEQTAVLGMACMFADAPDLAEFWRRCVDETKHHCPFPVPAMEGEAIDVLKKVIEQAARDAGILTDTGLMPGVRVLVCSPDGNGEKIQTALNGLPGIRDEQAVNPGFFEFYGHEFHRSGFDDSGFLETALKTSRQPDVDFVIAAAMHEAPMIACAAVVFCSRPGPASGKQAYALVQSIDVVEEDRVTHEITALPGKGVGHLVFLAAAKPGWGKPDTGPQGVLSAVEDHPRAFYPGCFLSCPDEGEDSVSAVGAVIRAAMSLNSKIISPGIASLHGDCRAENAEFYPNRETRPWIHDASRGPRRAAAGIPVGKDKTALIVMTEVTGEHPPGLEPRPVMTGLTTDSELIVLSADTAMDLSQRVRLLGERLRAAPFRLDRAACLISSRFDARKPHRLALVCKSGEELVRLLETSHLRLQASVPDFESEEAIYYTPDAFARSGRIACLFPGLGFPGLLGPYADHLMSLALHFPEIREVFDSVEGRDHHSDDPVPTSLILFPPAGWPDPDRSRLRKRLASPRIEDGFERKDPACRNLSSFGVSVANWACWRLLRELDIRPDFLFGQSLGEISALCASGAIEFSDFIRICWEVSIDAGEQIKRGRLALVGAGVRFLAPFLENFPDVHVAIHVGPEFQILGGDSDSLRKLVDQLRQQGIWTHFLPYPAIHTPSLTGLRPLMEPHLRNLAVKPPKIPVYSGMTVGVYPDDIESIRQLMIDNIDHPVFLWQTTQKIYEDGARILIQAGGGATMYAQARTNIKNKELTALSLDVDYRSAVNQLHHLCAELLVNGVDVRIRRLFQHRGLDTRDTASLLSCLDMDLKDVCGLTEVRMPFIGRMLTYEENVEIAVERVIDLNRDLFVQDHLFVNARSVKPASACLPVVPMTVSLEMMAEAAACLAPGCGLTGFEDVRASQWMAFLDCETLQVQIRARCRAIDPATGIHRIAAAVFTSDNSKPAIQGTVLMGRHYVNEFFPEFTPIDEPCQYPFEEKAVYGERHLFHGPAFHCITGRPAIAGKKVIGTLRAMPRDGMFSFLRAPEFLCDPVLLDGVGQLAGLWAMNQGKHVFPVGVKKIEIYCPTPEIGSDLPILLEIKEFSPKILAADVEIQDGKGRVWMRIHRWQDWVFHWPRGIYDFRRKPEHSIPSHGLSGNGIPSDAVVQYVSKNDLKDVWLDVAARFFLHPDEIKDMARIRAQDAKWQWLMGRIAVKDALRRWLAGPSGRMLHPAGMVIEEEENGNHVLKNPDHPGQKPFICLHSSAAAAVAAVSAVPLEIDVNRIFEQIENPRSVNEKEPVIWRLSN